MVKPKLNHLVVCRRRTRRAFQSLGLCAAICASAGACATAAPGTPSTPIAGALVSSTSYAAPRAIHAATARLLIHDMPRTGGGLTRASSLLFVPRGVAPAGGWPVVAWAHGTTTVANKACAPSLSPDLDGGLTADGFTTHYVEVIGALVDAGYAVVAPDFEGLGEIASVPYPYYNATSLARSLIAAVRAARQADRQLSSRWAVVGHSDGGHAALAVEAHASEAPELSLRGTVAYAPFIAVADRVTLLGDRAASDPGHAAAYVNVQNALVANLTAGLLAQSPDTKLDAIMGADLRALLPAMTRACVLKAFGDLAQAIAGRAPGAFAGLRTDWAAAPAMRAFLAANDPAVMPGFALQVPTLIVAGTEDIFVAEPLVADFSARLIAARAPVTYRAYAGVDHSAIVTVATPEVLSFLAGRFRDAAAGP